MTSEEIIQQRIAELESLLEKQKEELEKLKQEINSEPDLSPYSDPGYYYVNSGMIQYSANIAGQSIEDYARFKTREQAEWQAKSDRARRKLYHLMTRLNPKGWKPQDGNWYSIPIEIGGFSVTVGHFYSSKDCDLAQKELKDELQYFDWFSSPQAKGE